MASSCSRAATDPWTAQSGHRPEHRFCATEAQWPAAALAWIRSVGADPSLGRRAWRLGQQERGGGDAWPRRASVYLVVRSGLKCLCSQAHCPAARRPLPFPHCCPYSPLAGCGDGVGEADGNRRGRNSTRSIRVMGSPRAPEKARVCSQRQCDEKGQQTRVLVTTSVAPSDSSGVERRGGFEPPSSYPPPTRFHRLLKPARTPLHGPAIIAKAYFRPVRRQDGLSPKMMLHMRRTARRGAPGR